MQNLNYYRLKAVGLVTLAKQINEMKSQNYPADDASLDFQYIPELEPH